MTFLPDRTEQRLETLEEKGSQIANSLMSSLEFISKFGKREFWNNPYLKKYQPIAAIFTNLEAIKNKQDSNWLLWKEIDEDATIEGFLRGLTDKSRPPKPTINSSPLKVYQEVIRTTFSMGRRTRIQLWEQKNYLEDIRDRSKLNAVLSQIPNDQVEVFSHLVSSALFLRDIIRDEADYETILGFQKGLVDYLKTHTTHESIK